MAGICYSGAAAAAAARSFSLAAVLLGALLLSNSNLPGRARKKCCVCKFTFKTITAVKDVDNPSFSKLLRPS